MSEAWRSAPSTRLARWLLKHGRVSRRTLSHGVVLLSLSASLPASAQSSPKAAARVHFQKGVTAFNERRYADAAAEFDTAYRLSPAYVVLYNIGQVNVALGNPVEAVDAFDEYLKQGASNIPPARLEEVQAEIEEQQSRIGSLAIVSHPEQAEIRIDGKRIAMSRVVRVKAGHHTVEATLAPHQPQVRELDVPGQVTLNVDFTFAEDSPKPAAPEPPPLAPAPVAAAPAQPVAAEVVRVEPVAPIIPLDSGTPPGELHKRAAYRVNWLRTGGFVIAAGGVAVAAVGAIYAVQGANEAARARTRMTAATTPEQYDAAQPDYDLGKARNQRGWLIAGCGGAGALIGILIAAAAPERVNTAFRPWLTANGGGVLVFRNY